MTKLLKTILIISTLFISINILASDYTYGIKIGGTYSIADRYENGEGYSNETIYNDYYWGTYFSFYGYRKFHKMMDLQFEANYNQRGVSYHYENSTNTTYVTIPSLELISLLKLNINNFNLYIGAFTSLTLLDKRENSSFKFFSPNANGYFTGEGDVALDYGFTLGLEFKYKKYLIDFRYNKGFNDFMNHENSNAGHYHYDNSRQFVISLGHEF